MLLDRIDIDAHGPLSRVELGPFAEHLNVVCGPEGSGKTAIARFVRDSLVSRDYPLGMLSSSAGRVVWADRNGLVHCRRERDGTVQGRRTMEFESRGEMDHHFSALNHSWLDGVCNSTDSSRAARSIQLPESIVDGVITDTAVTSVARVVSACVRSGLDSHETYQSLPLRDESLYHDRVGYSGDSDGHEERQYDRNRRLREQLSEVETELARFGRLEADHQALVERRNRLAARLARPEAAQSAAPAVCPNDRSRHANWQQRLTELHDRARQLRARQSELRRWIEEMDADLANHGAYHRTHAGVGEYPYDAAVSDANLRRQLDDLDAQMIRWRRALLEVRGLRGALLGTPGDFANQSFSPLDESSLRRFRLDGFLHAVDRYDRSRNWDEFYPESHRPLHHIDDIDHRIDSATRQIDWLLERYAGASKPQHAWYETIADSDSYRSATTLGDTLRAIREDLRQVQRSAFRGPHPLSYQKAGELEELRRSEHWLVAAVERLNHHRQSLLNSHAPTGDAEVAQWSQHNHHGRHVLDRQRSTSIAELDRVTSELDSCLREAADLRRSMRSLPVIDSQWYDDSSPHGWIDREAVVAELRRIDDRLVSSSRVQWLRTRRAQLLEQLPAAGRVVDTNSPLAGAASRWLIRLSAGRLKQIDWALNRFRDNGGSYHRDTYQRTGVTINGRDESECPAADRALAVMAVRLAAGDLLARTGRAVPLVFETHREMFSELGASRHDEFEPSAYHELGDHFRRNHPVAAALRDYSRAGRQLVMLTSNQDLAAQLSRVGARAFQIHSQRVVHPHRPLWRPHYESEQYVGPHPHTYGVRDADEVSGFERPSAPINGTQRNGHQRSGHQRSGHQRSERRPAAVNVDVNRDFDMAWREAYGFYDNPDRAGGTTHVSGRTDCARDGVDYRDGYYFSDSYTTVAPQQPIQYAPDQHWAGQTPNAATSAPNAAPRSVDSRRISGVPRAQAPASPFFLSVDSPVDQAPSIDAVAAARLRGLKVTHINHLMQQDSNRLADALGLANVDAATIRRWQSECRLVCRVPQLRGFDARVLVGCGVTTPAQLASIHPVDLLQEVEAFLATEQGQRILLSGSSHELSRITSWIAAANSSSDRNVVAFGRGRSDSRSRDSGSGRRSYYRGFHSDHDADYAFDSDRYEYDEEDPNDSARNQAERRRRIIRKMNDRDAAQSIGRSRSRRSRVSSTDSDGSRSQNGRRSRSTRGSGSARRSSGVGSGSGNATRSSRSERGTAGGRKSNRYSKPASHSSRSSRRPARVVSDSEPARDDVVRYERQRAQRESAETREHESRQSRDREEKQSEHELRFYLHRESPIVDAPSIGSRMAERLQEIGIYTVDDLLNADAETVASELDHRRVDADTVLQWQQQATLVCRVPMLRGHDAQLMVAAEVTTPEELAASDADDLFGVVDAIARSREGKRIVRGGKLPDLEEVTEWIGYAQHHRELRAA